MMPGQALGVRGLRCSFPIVFLLIRFTEKTTRNYLWIREKKVVGFSAGRTTVEAGLKP
jgi:hypothetical protein